MANAIVECGIVGKRSYGFACNMDGCGGLVDVVLATDAYLPASCFICLWRQSRCFRRVKTTWRAWAFFFVLYMLAAFQLYRAGMAGSGRTTLIIIPLYALLLAGFRSAWVALALDILLYGGLVGLLEWGPLAADIEVHENPTLPGYWILQGTLVLAGVMPLLILLGRF